jgi:hypothetical protein
MNFQDETDRYLASYPKLLKWINQCHGCKARGLKPEIPEQIHPKWTASDGNLRKMFGFLALDKNRLCEMCAAAVAPEGD